MPTDEVKLSYTELRAIVIAIHERGQQLRADLLTFSHGHIGWDWIRLAERLDGLVADCEKTDQFSLVKDTDLEAIVDGVSHIGEAQEIYIASKNAQIKELEDYICGADNFRAGVKAILGSIQMNDDQALDQVERLVKAEAIKAQQPKRRKKK